MHIHECAFLARILGFVFFIADRVCLAQTAEMKGVAYAAEFWYAAVRARYFFHLGSSAQSYSCVEHDI
jgi:hypothetical protein